MHRRHGIRNTFQPLCGLAALAAMLSGLGACASAPPARVAPLTVHDTLPSDAPKGFIEFFCTDCLTSFSVFVLEGGKEVYVTNFVLGQSTSAAVQTTGAQMRLKRLRIAQPPGEHEYRLAATSPGFREPSLRIKASLAQDSLTPIRVEFIRHTSKSLDWKPIVAEPLPLAVGPTTQEALASALSAPDWGTRWYAAEIVIMSAQPLASETGLAQRLRELSSEDGYNACVEHEDVFACSMVREQATRAVTASQANTP
jgi:hypothetical protein